MVYETDRKGYCEHGVYVGGCGIDWMCPHCEDGVSARELRAMRRKEERWHKRRQLMHWVSTRILTFYIERSPKLPGRQWAIRFHIRHGRWPVR